MFFCLKIQIEIILIGVYIFEDVSGLPTQPSPDFIADEFNIDNWTLSDFLSDKSKQAVKDLLQRAFRPINKVLDKYDKELTDMEQHLTTALKQVRNLMIAYRAQDNMDERYVL